MGLYDDRLSPDGDRYGWTMQKDRMMQSLLEQGKTPEEADRLIAQITGLQRGAGNIPSGHQDAVDPSDILSASEGIPNPQAQMGGPGAPVSPQMASTNTDGIQGPPVAGVGTGASASPSAAGTSEPEDPYSSPFENPDVVSAVLGRGDLNRQMSTAEAMRDQEGVQGRYVSRGRVYAPGHAAEHLVRGLTKRKGRKDAKRIAGEQKESQEALIELLRDRKKQAPQMTLGSGGPVI